MDISNKCRCFKCRKHMEPSCNDGNAWNAPNNGVVFSGGSNFGSSLYDSIMNGINVEIVICDECLKIAKKDDGRLREFIINL